MKKAESLIDILVRREDQSDPSTLSKRELAIRDLAAALEEDREKLSASKLLLLVESLPTLIQVKGSETTKSSFLRLLAIVASTFSVTDSLIKVVPRIITITNRLILFPSQDSSLFAMSILRTIAIAPNLQPHMQSHAIEICHAILMKILIRSEKDDGVCGWEDLCDPDQLFSAEVFALYSALKSPEQWISDFHALLSESLSILSLLGIISIRSTDIQSIPQIAGGGKDSESAHSQTHTCDNSILTMLRKTVPSSFSQLKSGKQRVSYLTRLFHVLSTLIQQCILTGCSSGVSLQLNLSVFLTAVSAVMGYWKTENPHDPVSAIENERGISPLDLQAVVAIVKMSMLQLVSQIMYVNPPHIMRYGTAFLRPVLSLLAQIRKKSSSNRVTVSGYTLLSLALQFLALSAASLPNALSEQINNSNGSSKYIGNSCADLLELFRDEMTFLSAERSSLLVTTTSSIASSTAGSSSDGYADVSIGRSLLSSNYFAYLVELFNAIESLLLHCGGLLLSSAVIAHIDGSVGMGLVALCKGVLPPQFAEKRLQRFPCEFIRSHPELQCHFLRLSTAAVLASQTSRVGGLNGNLAIFRSACTNCLSHPLTKGPAALGLSILHGLLTPTGTVPLPAVSTVETAKVFLEASRRSTEIDSAVSTEQDAPPQGKKKSSSGESRASDEEEQPVFRKRRLNDDDVIGSQVEGNATVEVSMESDITESAAQKDQRHGQASSNAVIGKSEHIEKKKMQPIIQSRTSVSEVADSSSNSKMATKSSSSSSSSRVEQSAVVDGDGEYDSDDELKLPDIDIDADPDT